MLGLSTSWNSLKHKDGIGLIDEIKAIGFDTVELNFALTETIVEDILSLKNKGKINISSLHNICPLPKEIDPDEASPDYYSLASPDEEERTLAVEAAKNTISYAKKLDAKAVVLHIGRVQIRDRMRDLAAALDDKQRYNELKTDLIKERMDKKDGYLANVIKSLRRISPYAREMGIMLGIENRYYYREIPLIDEMAEIFRNFKPGDLYYWHDIGHAQVFENLGLARHKDFLEGFRSRLIGVHLHDIIAPISDHKVPGTGMIDFRMIKPYLNEETIRVLEVHQPATADEVQRGAEYLEKILD